MSPNPSLQVKLNDSLAEVPREKWDALVGEENAFLEWNWLAGLEETACVAPEKGWGPRHLTVWEGDTLVGAVPMYLKGHSEGEFVFDYQWAHAAESAGLAYYPKLLVAVPFTPANGLRFLTLPGLDRPALIALMARSLMEIVESNNLSGLHVNFCTDEERDVLASLGFLTRQGMQYHWENQDYKDFEGYLSRFRSKRRTKIRRERKELHTQGITIRVVQGAEITSELMQTMYVLYKEHVEGLYWGRRYLNADFFQIMGQRFQQNITLILAEQEGKVIAGTFNVEKNNVFYGRYWGSFKDAHFLHFNVCYYAAIEHCIRSGVKRFEPGAGGEFKQLRGFDARPTYSMHYLTHPGLKTAVEGFLEAERTHTQDMMEHINAGSQLKNPENGGNEE